MLAVTESLGEELGNGYSIELLRVVSDKLCYNNGEGWIYPDLGRGSKSAINSFCDAINGDGEPLFGIDDAVALTKTMEMAYKNIV